MENDTSQNKEEKTIQKYKVRIDKIFFRNGTFFILGGSLPNHQSITLKGKVSSEQKEKIDVGVIIEVEGVKTYNEEYKKEEIKINEGNINIKTEQEDKDLKVLEGLVDRIIFQNKGFNVFVIKDKDDNETTCVSHSSIFVGTEVKLKGNFKRDEYGLSFKVKHIEEKPFSSKQALIHFLSSKFFKGIGKVYATKIVDKFGMDTIDILKKNPKKLTEISGIGEKRAESIIESFKEKMQIKEIIEFAVKYNLSEKMIFKLFNKYGWELINLLHKNPYIITELHGIGFKKADEIAQEMGIEKESNYRINSFLNYFLLAKADGNTFFRLKDIVEEVEKELEINQAFDQVLDAYFNFEKIKYQVERDGELKTEYFTKDFVLYHINDLKVLDDEDAEILRSKLCISAKMNFEQEKKIFLKYKDINFKKAFNPLNNKQIDEMIKGQERNQGFEYADKQREVLQECLKHKLVVLTGKAGTGKSTVSKGLVEMYQGVDKKVLNLAPTGKAAKRVVEVTGKDAHTIHSACFNLDFNDYDVIMVDEAGMLSTFVAYMLFRMLEKHHTLVLIGDVAQIPPVQAGNIFRDTINMIKSEFIDGLFVELNEIKRQDSDSYIASVCNKIAKGENPGTINYPDIRSVKKENEEVIEGIIKIIHKEMRERKIGFDKIQVISPQYRSIVGVNAINERIQEEFNDNEVLIESKRYNIKKHDKVMQTKNIKELGIVNGDTLKVIKLEEKETEKSLRTDGKKDTEKIVVCKLDNGFEDRYINYPLDMFMRFTTLAYCCSAHKMQGSEYPVVIYVLSTSHYIMLNRNLLYTGLTRGKEKVYLIGQAKAFHIALNNEVNQSRNTVLDLINRYKIDVRKLIKEKNYKQNTFSDF